MFAKKIYLALTISAMMAVLAFTVSALNRSDVGYSRLGLFHRSPQPASPSSPDFIPISVCPGCLTYPNGVNERGVISGSYFDSDGGTHGFIKKGGSYITIDPPTA